MLHAIVRCSSDSSSLELPDVSICMTLEESCGIFETNPDLNKLEEILISKIDTYFYCPSCNETPNSIISSSTQIFIFNLRVNNQIVAYPVISKDHDASSNSEQFCTYCKYSTTNIDLPVYKQVFHKCPFVLLKFVNRDVSPDNIFKSEIKLTDSSGQQFIYKATAIIIISR
ncbi:unnamed protein product, partial [Rotaria sp. Silwood2]